VQELGLKVFEASTPRRLYTQSNGYGSLQSIAAKKLELKTKTYRNGRISRSIVSLVSIDMSQTETRRRRTGTCQAGTHVLTRTRNLVFCQNQFLIQTRFTKCGMCVVASGGGGRGGLGACVNRSSFSLTQRIAKIFPYKSLQRSLTSNFLSRLLKPEVNP
jgi:hypothetical protein